MRNGYLADWAFASKNEFEKTFDFEGYIWNSTHIILILRDKLSGIVTGNSKPNILDDANAPHEAPNFSNLGMWQSYLRNSSLSGLKTWQLLFQLLIRVQA